MSMTMQPADALTALEGAEGGERLAVSISDAGLQGMVTLRGDLESAALKQAVRDLIGAPPPAQRRFIIEDGRAALWMAPDELLLRLPYEEVGEAVQLLDAALDEEPHLAVDVSDARQIIEVSGAGARDLLAKGAPIDLHPSAFRIGHVRRTRISQVASAIYLLSENPDHFEVFCFRSYGRYLFDWLTASAKPSAMPHVFDSAAAADLDEH